MAGVIVGPVGKAMAPVLSELHGRCFAEAWSEASFEGFLETPGAKALIAADGGDPVGFLLYRVGADEAEIVTIGVRPDRRLSGAGRALLAAGLDGMRADGARACFLEVAVDNHPAKALYAAAGFRPVGRRPGYYREAGRPVDAAVLRLDFGPPAG